jgi:hypothetical protein
MSGSERQEGTGEAISRPGLRKELIGFYGRTFRDIYHALRESEELDFFFLMHSTEEVLQSVPQSGSEVRLHPGGSYMLLREVLEDYGAAYLCFISGFTRQARGILRGTFASALRIYSMRYSKNHPPGKAEYEIPLLVETIRRLLALKGGGLSGRLQRLYRLLYGEASCGKLWQARLRLPWTRRAKGPGFDPVDVLNVKGLFLSLLDFELRLLSAYLGEGGRTVWTAPALSAISGVLEGVNKYRPTIGSYEAGYLLRKEPARLEPGLEVIYSVRIDGSTEYHRPKPRDLKVGQLKRLEEIIRQRLLLDLY